MQTLELEKSKLHVLIEIIDYVQNSTVTKTIIQKTTGKINIIAIDTGGTIAEKILPFDTFLQIIEGIAEVIIDEKSNILKTGQAIIVPAHVSSFIRANERFKMISTVIKSGYEITSI